MFTTLFLVLVLAQDTNPLKDAPDITKEQEKLIEQMGDKDFRTREKATVALEKMDYKAIKAYYKAVTHQDLEIRTRAQVLISRYYSVLNGKGETPGIQGLYEMKSFKLKSGKTMEIKDSDANDYYKEAGGDSEDFNERQDANNHKTRDATGIMVKKLRNKGFTKEEVREVLDKITEEGNGNEMGNPGYRKFREMQGLPEYEPWGPGLGFGVFPGGPNPFLGLRNMIFRNQLVMPPACP